MQMNPYIIAGLDTMKINRQISGYEKISLENVEFCVISIMKENDQFLDFMESQKLDIDFDTITFHLKSSWRRKELVKWRHCLIYFIRTYMDDVSLKTVGQFVGGRDHSTIIHAVNTYRDSVSVYPDQMDVHLKICKRMCVENKIEQWKRKR